MRSEVCLLGLSGRILRSVVCLFCLLANLLCCDSGRANNSDDDNDNDDDDQDGVDGAHT